MIDMQRSEGHHETDRKAERPMGREERRLACELWLACMCAPNLRETPRSRCVPHIHVRGVDHDVRLTFM